jgi:PilZ domain-containing protein
METAMSDRASDRRHMARHTAVEQHGIVSVRIRPGHRAHMIDVSAGGVLLETSYRLLPGTKVDLQMENAADRTNVRGRVIRCAVVRVRPATICYRGAIAFDRHLPWFVETDGYAVPGAEHREGRRARADVTRELV